MLDRVLVVVNDDIITYGEFDTALKGMRKKLQAVDEPLPPENILKEKVCTGLPVVDDERLVGVISKRDFKKIKKSIDQTLINYSNKNLFT